MSEKNNHVMRDSSLRRRKTAYHYRRRSKALFVEHYNAELKQVLGFTLKTNCSFSCDPNTGLLAYPAGCVIVLYDPRKDKQIPIFNPGQKTITCLRFANDGNFIVTGEAGHQPCVRVFSVQDRCQIGDFSSHKFGISNVAFSPNGKYVVSVGFQHDNVINVWNWKKSKLAASNKVSTKIKSIAFAEDSSHFITVGNRHVKFWYLEDPSADKTTIPLKGRSAILENLRNHVFCDVICGIGCESSYSFAITRSGILCQFNAGRTVEKFVELKCSSARSLCAFDDLVLCGCSSGSVHLFKAQSLEFVTEIIPIEQLRGNEIIAISVDIRNMWMHCVFEDHSFVVYDVMNLASPTVHSFFQFHNACVWDVKSFPWINDSISFSKDCFVTCSNDGSARLWRFDGNRWKLLKIIKLQRGKFETSSKLEARSLSIRSDGSDLAIGDRAGNIHIYDVNTFERIAFVSTHEGDVLGMDYSPNGEMLASSSRDRCVHIFDASYNPTHTIADHSASVTSVKFSQHDDELRLVTCGADKSLYFCSIASSNAKTEINREQHFVERHSMSDMAVLDETVLVACGCNLSEYDIVSGKQRRTFRGSEGTTPIVRVAVNSHRSLIATSCTDKNIYVLGFSTTDCLCVLNGHSEMAVALTFDFENRLLSASADSCIFVWALIQRLPDDAKNIQSQSSNPNSNASTPDSPEANRTAYFVESLPTIEQDDEFFTPRPLNGESISAFITSDVDLNENSKSVTPIADSNVSELPTWVTKALPGDSEVIPDPTPRLPLGKWGHKLEADKICEELGNLPVSADVSSIRSSIDDDEMCDDHSSQTAVESDVTEPILGHDDDANRELPTIDDDANRKLPTIDDDARSSGDSTLVNQSRDAESKFDASNNVRDNNATDKDADVYVLESSEAARVETKETPNSVNAIQQQSNFCSEKALKPFKIDVSLGQSRVAMSIADEIATADAATANSARVEFSAPTEATPTVMKINTDESSLRSSSQSTLIEEETPSCVAILTVSEEDIDLRKVHYQRKNEELLYSRTKPSAFASDEHELHSTPKSHFTTIANIKLNPVSHSPKPESRCSDKEICNKPRPSEQVVDFASKRLINHVLISAQESPIDVRDVIDTSDCDDPKRAVPVKSRRQNVVSQVAATNDQDEVITSGMMKKQETDKTGINKKNEKPTLYERKVSSEGNRRRDKAESGATRNSEVKSRQSNENSGTIPPAFAELLARLSKKSNTSIVPTVRKSTSCSRETGFSIPETEQPLTSRFRAKPTANKVFDAGKTSSEFFPRSSETSSSSLELVDECQQASDDLMAAFCCAEKVYRKHKARHDSEALANGSLSGLNKLSRSFQKIYSRLSQIKGVSNSVHPDPDCDQRSVRSVSLENLANDSPVFSLLREYSDKLVGIVHSHVDSKLLSTPADTV